MSIEQRNDTEQSVGASADWPHGKCDADGSRAYCRKLRKLG